MNTESVEYYLDCIEKGISLYWRTLGKARGMEVHTGDIEYVKPISAPGPERVYKIRLSPETAGQRMDELLEDVKNHNIPDSFLITTGSTPDNLSDLFIKRGFTVDTSGSCMALDLAGFDIPESTPENLRIVVVENTARLKEWVEIVNTALFECEILSYDQFSDIYCLKNTRFFLALIDGIPAAVSMTIFEDDIATLEMVATLKEYRRKGLATAVITAALKYLQECGIKTVTLRAEPAAVGVYKRAGFRELCKRVVACYNRNQVMEHAGMTSENDYMSES